MATLDASLPTLFQESAHKQKPMQVNFADHITAKTTGIRDAEHIDASQTLDAHLVLPQEGYRTAAPAFEHYVDVEPRSPNVVAYDKSIKFLFGLEGGAQITAVDIFFEAGAIAQTASAGAADETVYPAYLAERLLGKEVEIKLQNERVEKYNVEAMHWERLLMQDVANSEREGYEDGVGINETTAAQTVWCRLRMPFNRRKPFIALAHSEELQLSFSIPKWEEIRRYRGGRASSIGADSALTSTAPSLNCFIRVHYHEVDKPTRALLTSRLVDPSRAEQPLMRYHVSVLETEEEDFSVAAGVAGEADAEVVEVDSKLSLVHPTAVLIGVIRHKSDTEKAISLSGSASEGFDDMTIAKLEDGSCNPCPDPFRALPPVWWEVCENKNRILPRMTWRYFSAAMHPKYFPSENYVPAAITCYTPHPTLAADHSLGHQTHSNMHLPTLKIGFRRAAYFDEDEDVADLRVHSREVEIKGTFGTAGFSNGTADGAPAAADFNGVTMNYNLLKISISPNFVEKQGGRIWLSYQ